MVQYPKSVQNANKSDSADFVHLIHKHLLTQQAAAVHAPVSMRLCKNIHSKQQPATMTTTIAIMKPTEHIHTSLEKVNKLKVVLRPQKYTNGRAVV